MATRFHVNNIEARHVRFARRIAKRRGEVAVVKGAEDALREDYSREAEAAALIGLAYVCEFLNRTFARV